MLVKALPRVGPVMLALGAVLALSVQAVQADEINIAVAANFLGTLQKLAPQFERASTHKLVLSSGSSGQLYAQIVQGAPFDVLLSADAEKPKMLEAAGLAVPGSGFTYAVGTLVLWSPKAGLIDRGGQILQARSYRFVGVADPDNAPYGAAAREVLRTLGLWDQLTQEHKLVTGENITQAWQFAASGNVDMAFVALSQVLLSDGSISGSSWLPPQSMYTRIDQDAVVLAHGSHRAAAEAFVSWLHHDPLALAAIQSAGYGTAD
ncbi:MAG: molybdate ABC transporter substrate-binding protein [Steroidobacteraceae bacterium]|jgi:molybdate transport system substrate-binding protein